MAGYLYYQGKQIASTKSAGSAQAALVIETGTTKPDLTWSRCTFHFARVAKALSGSSANNYDSMFFLDKHPGDYEMKVLREGKLARSVEVHHRPRRHTGRQRPGNDEQDGQGRHTHTRHGRSQSG